MHGQPQRRQHAPAGPDTAQRSDVRRGGARARPAILGERPRPTRHRIERLYERALRRAPKPSEERDTRSRLPRRQSRHTSVTILPRREQAARRSADAPTHETWIDQVELAAWTEVCRVMLNLHETITRY